MTTIYDPIPFVNLVKKMLGANYEPIFGICGKYSELICSICKCCSCCGLNINFQNV